MPPPVVCLDCEEAKETAQAREAATPKDGLKLGDCQPLYKRWADCVAENGGTGAKECVTALKEFRACHKKSTDLALSNALKQ